MDFRPALSEGLHAAVPDGVSCSLGDEMGRFIARLKSLSAASLCIPALCKEFTVNEGD